MTEKTFLGKRIVITRPRAQSKELQRALEDSGAKCSLVPRIDIAQPDDEGTSAVKRMTTCT